MNLYLLLTYIQINALVNFKNSKKFYVERVSISQNSLSVFIDVSYRGKNQHKANSNFLKNNYLFSVTRVKHVFRT